MTGRTLRAAAAVALGMLLLAVPATPARADSVRDQQWYLATLQVDRAQRLASGDGVTVAVIDSGVDARHPDLVGSVLSGRDLLDPGGVAWSDELGHGTAMAAIIAAHGHGDGGRSGVLGVAPAAKVLPIRLYRRGENDPTVDEAGGIRWATDHGARVMNMSYGGAPTPELVAAVAYAIDHDVVVVAASGSGGGPLPAPARLSGVVAVGGVDRRGNPAASRDDDRIAVVAPSVDVMSAVPGGGYGMSGGSSSATAVVSGVAALIRARFPDLDAPNVVNRLIRSADDKGRPGRDPTFGFGVVNAYRALTEDIPRVATNPLITATASSTPAPTAQRPSATPKAASNGWRWLVVALVVVAVAAIPAVVLVRRRRARTDARRARSDPA